MPGQKIRCFLECPGHIKIRTIRVYMVETPLIKKCFTFTLGAVNLTNISI